MSEQAAAIARAKQVHITKLCHMCVTKGSGRACGAGIRDMQGREPYNGAGYTCNRARGHAGPHVECTLEGHAMHVWGAS